ncbi:histone acetyltransferase MCC1-like isoform X2 [Gastrolobium bilobum]|uniref:histone acetyltransferase MCC1-like isoform X2 n=1 Tax=Gastrolobium bilobum TaxID=150636 RepID=UPI002AB0E72C|nr:histone acetyltransferase MCC1-like isoform X2 [Gastrolobium bilobum]
MVNPKVSSRPKICYRPIRPSDLDILEHIHGKLFPIRYESAFFQDVVNGHDIVSWGAVDSNRPDGQSDELIGFVTARIVLAKESEIMDMLGYDSSKSDQTLVYILTLGVVESYRNHGIASSLIREVIKYAGFYLINGQHYDSYLFLYYVNGGRSPCSPLELLTAIVSYLRSGIKSVAGRLCKSEDRKISRWAKCKESHSLVSATHNKRNLAVECTGYECV